MKFSSKQIKGKGRGKLLGFPTINLEIPLRLLPDRNDNEGYRDDSGGGFDLKDGIYAALVTIDGKEYKGALYFGPIPTFEEKDKSLEVFLIDAGLEFEMEGSGNVDIEIKDFIREIRNFDSNEELVRQIKEDVRVVRELLII